MEYSYEDLDKLRRHAITALGRVTNNRGWEDWKVIGQFIETGRQWAMRMSNSNAPIGVRYNNSLNVWFGNNPRFRDNIGKDERNDLMRCMENAEVIAEFLKALDPKRARELNHPTSVWRAYKRSEADKEKQAAAAKADAAAAESVKGDDGTPFNIPIKGGPTVLSKTDVNAWGVAVDLRKTYGDEMAGHIARSLFKLLKMVEPI